VKKLTGKEVEKIARLARIELTEEEKHRFREVMNEFLSYAGVLDGIDTGHVKEGGREDEPDLRLRSDEVTPSLRADQVLMNCPDHSGGFIRVPRVLPKKGREKEDEQR